MSSDAVGYCKLKMSNLIINCGVDDWFEIMYQNQLAGHIHLITKFEPANDENQENEEVEGDNADEGEEIDEKIQEGQEEVEAEKTE